MRIQSSRAGLLVLASIAVLTLISACGDSSNASSPVPTATQPAVAPTPTVPAAPEPTATSRPAVQPTVPSGDDALALGQLIFEETAGTIGCAYCHGFTGDGNGAAGEGAPYIRGASKSAIRGALTGGVPLMGFIKLNETELDAVTKYLLHLADVS